MNDRRDPVELGETLLDLQGHDRRIAVQQFGHSEPFFVAGQGEPLSKVYDENERLLKLVPAHPDASTIEKYGDPRDYSVKIETRRVVIHHPHVSPTEALGEATNLVALTREEHEEWHSRGEAS